MTLDKATKDKLNRTLNHVALAIRNPSTELSECLCVKTRCRICASIGSYGRKGNGKYHLDACSGYDYVRFNGNVQEHFQRQIESAERLLKNKTQNTNAHLPPIGQTVRGTFVVISVVEKDNYCIVKGIMTNNFDSAKAMSFISSDMVTKGIYALEGVVKGHFHKSSNLKSAKLWKVHEEIVQKVVHHFAIERTDAA